MNIDPDQWESTPPILRDLILNLIDQVSQLHGVNEGLTQTIDSLRLDIEKYSEEHAREINRKDSLRQSVENQFNTDLVALISIVRNRPRSQKQIVFVCDTPITRQAKLARALRELGWETILLHKNKPWFDKTQYFAESHIYHSPVQAVLLSALYAPVAYHCFSSWDFQTTLEFIKYRPGKIVFDNYDYLTGCLREPMASRLVDAIKSEQSCVNDADGIVCRGLTLNVGKKLAAFPLLKKTLFFPEYCWGTSSKELLPKRSDGIHAVYVGGLEPQYFKDPSAAHGVCDSAFIKDLTDRRIHYHMYLFTTLSPEEFRRQHHEYFQEAEENPYFHLHESLPADELIKEISQYHFGLTSMSEHARQNGDWTYLPDSTQRVTFNKVFDYIDAELIPVSYGWKTMESMIKGIMIEAERGKIGEILESNGQQILSGPLLSQLKLLKERYKVTNQAQRLASFYQAIR